MKSAFEEARDKDAHDQVIVEDVLSGQQLSLQINCFVIKCFLIRSKYKKNIHFADEDEESDDVDSLDGIRSIFFSLNVKFVLSKCHFINPFTGHRGEYISDDEATHINDIPDCIGYLSKLLSIEYVKSFHN